jgi:methylphosphotriester-DNA--protein-cysteine methyltransferase
VKPRPHEASFVGIQFAVGTALRFVDTSSLLDAGIALPDVRRGGRPAVHPRTSERRFRASTGLSRGAIDQSERVRAAAALLANGAVVDDVVHALGYYDEPHLARMLRRYVGRSAQQLRTGDRGSLALDPGHLTTSYSSLVTPFE